MADVHDCAACGCTEEDACIGPDGPCAWLFPNLCSSCVEIALEVLRELYSVKDRQATTVASLEHLLAGQANALRRSREAMKARARAARRRR